jgi:hypothetical protein
MFRFSEIVAFSSVLALALNAVAAASEGSVEKLKREEIQSGLKRVQEDLDRLKAGKPKVEAVTDDAVAHALPNHLVYAVYFRRFPVADTPPEPMALSSLYAVPRGNQGEVKLLTNYETLDTFFRDQLAPVLSDDQAKTAVRAWLRLAEALEQDGYYTFELLEDSLKVAPADGGRTASGRVVVKRGGNGEITATLAFDAQGKLVKVERGGKLKPGPRPRCQATKLLDPDPIVRGMAEDAVLSMGRAAKGYLDEQRAKATPELRQAIDRIWRRIERDQ